MKTVCLFLISNRSRVHVSAIYDKFVNRLKPCDIHFISQATIPTVFPTKEFILYYASYIFAEF